MWDVNVEILAVDTSLTVSCSGPTGGPKEAEDIKDVHEFGSSEMWFLYDYGESIVVQQVTQPLHVVIGGIFLVCPFSCTFL